MAPSISQIIATTYNTVVADARKPQNQWAENSFLAALEKKGGITKQSGGAQIEVPIDWQANAGAAFLATETTATSVTKTDVISDAVYDWAELVVPITTTWRNEAQANSTNEKISLAKNLITNALNSHDDLIEQKLFPTTFNNFLGLQTCVPDAGQPNVGGINGSGEVYWRNQTGAYLADGSDMEAQLTTMFNACAKGSGAKLRPSLVVSGSAAQAIYESGLVSYQRFGGDEANGGFVTLKFKDADYVFSQFGGTRVYMLNTTSFQLVVTKGTFRSLKASVQIAAATADVQKIYSLLQVCVGNPSRLGVMTQTP